MKRPIGTWEGAHVYIVRMIGGKPKITEFTKGKRAAMEESHKHPIGIIVRSDYDTGGIGRGFTESMGTFYKGRNAEVLSAEDLEHPHIDWIDDYLSRRSIGNEDNYAHLPSVDYERPDVNINDFRKKKSHKSKPKRKVVKKKKSCGCK